MLKLLTTLSRVGVQELCDFVGGRPTDPSVLDHEGWYRPARVHALEDRRVLAVSIVPSATTVTSPEGSSVTINAELQGGTSGQSYDVVFNWRDGSSSSTVNVTAAADGTAAVSASHTYADNANYTVLGLDPVTLTVTGEGASANVNVFITNVAPTISLSGNATSVNEGAVYSLTLGAVTDPGSDTVSSYRINWGDGTSTGFISGNPNGQVRTHTYADNGPRTITVDLVDEDGTHTGAGSLALTVNNVAPTIALTGNSTVNEGATYTLNLGAITDPGADTVTSYVIHWGDGTSSGTITGNPANTTATHIYSENASRTITVDLIDEDGTHTTAGSLAITVNNVAPTISLTGNSTANEGATYTLNLGAITDPGTDTVTSYVIHWGDGTSSGTITGNPASTTATHTYADNASRTITVDLIDEDGTHTGAGSLSVTVLNVAPTIALTGNATVNEGSTYTLNLGAITDPGADTVTSYIIHWGDGTSSGTITGNPASTTATHTYTDNGSRTITVDLIDEDGTHTGAGSLTITVNNVAPTIALTGNSTVNEGSTYTLNLGAITDPGTDTVTSYVINWGDGTSSGTISGNPANTTATHTYADGVNSRTITVDLIDEDGTHTGAGSLAITVSNVAPTIALTGNATVNEGSTYTLNLGAITDPGTDTVTSYQIHWGDGTSSGVIVGNPASTTATHTFTDDASRTITVDLIDEDGTHAAAGSLSVTVLNVAPTIALTGNSSVNEGSVYTLNLGAITNPGTDTITSYEIHWGDGTSSGVITGNPANTTATHTYADGATSLNITVDLTDEDGTYADAGSLALTVNNVAPAIALTGNATVEEGPTYTLNLGAITDPGTDTVTSYEIHWGDGTTSGVITGNPANTTATHTYADGDNSPTITVDLIDEDGTHVSAGSLAITVNNVAPTIALTGDSTVNEGSVYTLNLGTITDPGTDTVTSYEIHWGDGTSSGVITGNPASTTVTHTYTNDASRTITVDLVDEDGTHISAGTLAVTVLNVAPSIDSVLVNGVATSTVTITEGETVTLQVTFSDPGLSDFTNAQTLTNAVNWGDGAFSNATITLVSPGIYQFTTAAHTYSSVGTATIQLSIFDGTDTTTLNAVTVTVEDNNAPVVTIVTADPVNALEGGSVLLTVTYTDDGPGAPHTYFIDWGDGTTSGPTGVNGRTSGSFTASHTYADNGVFNVVVSVSDNSLLTGTDTIQVIVANVSPTITLSGNGTVNEGSVYTLNLGAITDPGTDTVTSYQIHWGDGTSSGVIAGNPAGTTATHTYADGNAARTITVDLIDEDGTHAAAGSLNVSVLNVPPTIALTGNATVNEGDVYTLSLGAITDPGTDTVGSYVINWGDGTSSGVITGSPAGTTATHTFADNGTPTITVDLIDEDGTHTAAGSLSITVLDVAPTIVLTGNATVDEGATYTLNLGAITDPGADVVTAYVIHWGDGTSSGTIVGSPVGASATHIYADDGARTITVDLINEDGTQPAAGSLSITVLNVAPTIPLTGNATVDEGSLYTLNLGSVVDPGTDTITDYEIHWGDGTSSGLISGSPSGTTATHVYADDGPRTIVVDLVDEDGSFLAAGSLSINVQNVPPTITVIGVTTINEGDVFTLGLGAVTDPGTDTVTAFRINWGDGTTTGVISGSPTGVVAGHVFGDDGLFNVTVELFDEDGIHVGATHTLTVNNVAPTIALSGSPTVNEGATFTLNLGAITDPGADTVSSYQIDWGDGTTSGIIIGSPAGAAATHAFADNSTPTISVDLIDEDGTFVAAGTLPVVVNNVAPSIASPLTALLVDSVGLVTLTVQFKDPGILDNLSLASAIDWGGRGVVPPGGDPVFTDMGNGTFVLTASFQFIADPPTPALGDPNPIPHFTVSFTVADKDGASVTGAIDANVPTGIARIQPEAPGLAPPLALPQSVAQTIPVEAPTSVAVNIESDVPSSSQSSVENTSAHIELREVLPNGREKLLGTFDENALDTVLGKLRGLLDRHYRVYMIMPDGSERLIVDVRIRQGQPTDPDAASREEVEMPPVNSDSKLQTESDATQNSGNPAESTGSAEEVDAPVRLPSIEDSHPLIDEPAAKVPAAGPDGAGRASDATLGAAVPRETPGDLVESGIVTGPRLP